MPNALISTLTVPVLVNGERVNVTYDIKDAYAREQIANLGRAVYWMGVTTTALTDGSTTNPITINSESVTADVGGMAQYNAIEFVWNGTAWQEMGRGNFGSLAFKNSASGSFTPSGSVSVSKASDTTQTVNSIITVGELPSFTVDSDTLVFNAGTLPTKGSNQTVLSAVGNITASFLPVAGTVTVS